MFVYFHVYVLTFLLYIKKNWKGEENNSNWSCEYNCILYFTYFVKRAFLVMILNTQSQCACVYNDFFNWFCCFLLVFYEGCEGRGLTCVHIFKVIFLTMILPWVFRKWVESLFLSYVGLFFLSPVSPHTGDLVPFIGLRVLIAGFSTLGIIEIYVCMPLSKLKMKNFYPFT